MLASQPSMANAPPAQKGLPAQPLRQNLRDVLHLNSNARRIESAAQMQDAAGIVGRKHLRTALPNVFYLPRRNAARDLGMIDRGSAAEATAHVPLGQIDESHARLPQ